VLPPVSLDEKEKEVGGISERETQARVFSLYADTGARILMVCVIAAIFIGLNFAVMKFLMNVFEVDQQLMAAKPPIQAADRLITTQLLMALIAATVVQVGVATIAIVSYLFPKPR